MSEKKSAQRKIFRFSTSLDKVKSRSGFWFVLPFIIGFALIYLPIIWNSLVFSFSEVTFDPWDGPILTNIGTLNYERVLTYGNFAPGIEGDNFFASLQAGFFGLIFEVPGVIIFSLFIAVLLNQKMMGRAAFRAIFFVPVIISTGLMETLAGLNTSMEEIITGTQNMGNDAQVVSSWQIGYLFSLMAIGGPMVYFVTELINNMFNVINRSGVQMLLFLAGLQSIPAEVYESCKIDGATAWETFWKITFPMISPIILLNTVYTIINFMSFSRNPIMEHINATHGALRFVDATAMSWIFILCITVLIVLFMGLMQAKVFYQRRDG